MEESASLRYVGKNKVSVLVFLVNALFYPDDRFSSRRSTWTQIHSPNLLCHNSRPSWRNWWACGLQSLLSPPSSPPTFPTLFHPSSYSIPWRPFAIFFSVFFLFLSLGHFMFSYSAKYVRMVFSCMLRSDQTVWKDCMREWWSFYKTTGKLSHIFSWPSNFSLYLKIFSPWFAYSCVLRYLLLLCVV